MKKIIFSSIIISIFLLAGLYKSDKPLNGKEVYPLIHMKKNDDVQWVLQITKVPDEEILVISDNETLYQNRKYFKVKVDENVYMSTPGYFVKIFKNEEEVQNYPVFYLEQIEFGTIKSTQGDSQGDGSVDTQQTDSQK